MRPFAGRSGARTLSLTPSHHELLRRCLARGPEAARARLAGTPAAATTVEVGALTAGTIGALDPEIVCGSLSSDVIAAVLQRFEGPFPGTALFALDPGDALLWLQREGTADDPLGRFVEWGALVLRGLVDPLATALGTELVHGAPALEERPLMAALLATHAPSDTVVLSLRGGLGFAVEGVPDALHAPFSLHLLLEPKIVAGIAAGLAAGAGPDDAEVDGS